MKNIIKAFRKKTVSPPPLPEDWEPVFTVDGETFYRFKSDTNFIKTGRFLFTKVYLDQAEAFKWGKDKEVAWLRLMEENVKALEEVGTDPVKVGKRMSVLLTLLREKKTSLAMTPDVDLIYIIAAKTFFLLGDDPAEDIDPEETERRVSLLKKKDLVSLLAVQPLTGLLLNIDELQGSTLIAFKRQLTFERLIRSNSPGLSRVEDYLKDFGANTTEK